MREFGYSDGKNLVIEWRHAEGDYKRLADLTTELLRMDRLSSPPRSILSAPGLSQVWRVRRQHYRTFRHRRRYECETARAAENDVAHSVARCSIAEPGNPADPAVLRHIEAV
jgi:hypothetical protein